MTKKTAKLGRKIDTKKIWGFTWRIAVAIMVGIGTIITIAYAYGYRISFDEREIEKTGVLDVQTDPTNGQLYIEGELEGRTPKTVGSLPEGSYNISVEKDGYVTWNKKVDIKAELSTPTYAHLFLEEKVEDSSYESQENLESVIYSKDLNHIFFVTATSTLPTQADSDNESHKDIKIFDYVVNKNFWDLSNNPITLASVRVSKNSNYTLLPSDNGAYLLFSETEPSTRYYLIKTNLQNQELTPIALDYFGNGYEITWAADNKHLILQSSQDIYSYDISTEAVVLLDKKNEGKEIVWTTAPYGIYYSVGEVEGDTENTSATDTASTQSYFYIKGKNLDGTKITGANSGSAEIIVDKIYYKDNPTFIQTSDIANNPFTHSAYGTRFCGRIEEIYANPAGEGFVLKTEFALYWYSFETEKYILVTNDTNIFLEFSPDNEKFTYINKYGTENASLNVFTMIKEDNDHTTKIGSKFLLSDLSMVDLTSIRWLQNSYFVSFVESGTVELVDSADNGDIEDGNTEDAVNLGISQNFSIIDIDGENFLTLDSLSSSGFSDSDAISETGSIYYTPIVNYSLEKLFVPTTILNSDDLTNLTITSFTIN